MSEKIYSEKTVKSLFLKELFEHISQLGYEKIEIGIAYYAKPGEVINTLIESECECILIEFKENKATFEDELKKFNIEKLNNLKNIHNGKFHHIIYGELINENLELKSINYFDGLNYNTIFGNSFERLSRKIDFDYLISTKVKFKKINEYLDALSEARRVDERYCGSDSSLVGLALSDGKFYIIEISPNLKLELELELERRAEQKADLKAKKEARAITQANTQVNETMDYIDVNENLNKITINKEVLISKKLFK